MLKIGLYSVSKILMRLFISFGSFITSGISFVSKKKGFCSSPPGFEIKSGNRSSYFDPSVAQREKQKMPVLIKISSVSLHGTSQENDPFSPQLILSRGLNLFVTGSDCEMNLK
jgi:hypothetical protein